MLRFYVWCRWVRLTTRRYGVVTLALGLPRSRHAACGRALRDTGWGRLPAEHGKTTGYVLMARDLIKALERERSYA